MFRIDAMIPYFGLLVFVPLIVTEKIDPIFTSDYFQKRNINQIVAFACWSERDGFDFSRNVINQGTKISYNDIQDDINIIDTLKVNYYKLGIVLDLDCQQCNIVLEKFTAARLHFNDSYHWLMVTTESEVPTDVFQRLPLSIESEVTVALAKKSTFALYDVYNQSFRHGGRINVTAMGRWSEENGLKNELTQYKYKRRQDFHGMTLNVSTLLLHKPEPDLETYLSTAVNVHLDTMMRFHYALILQLRDLYNFKINLKIENSWGYLVNGSFTGIIGQMQKGLVDIAGPFQFLSERIGVIEYTVESFSVECYYIFRHPMKNTVRNPFLTPLNPDVWWSAIALGILFWVLLLSTFKLERHYQPKNESAFYENASVETALITITAVSQQGSSEGPHLFSGRIIFLTLFLWVMMMFQFYGASIVSSLLAPRPKFIKNPWDLANSDLFLSYEDIPYLHAYWQFTTRPWSLNIMKKKMSSANPQQKPQFTNARDGLKRVSEGGYAFLIDTNTAYKIIENTFSQAHICELSKINVEDRKLVTLGTVKHSPFKKMVTYGLRKIVEAGLTKRLDKIWKHREPSCPESFRSQPLPVQMQEFSPAVFLLLTGMICATNIMIAEHLIVRVRRKGLLSKISITEENGSGLEEIPEN